MGFKFEDFIDDYVGEVRVRVDQAVFGAAKTGSEKIDLHLTVVAPTDKYDLNQHKDPTDFTIVDSIWLPMESDRGVFNAKGTEKYANKAKAAAKMAMAFGFVDEMPDDGEAFQNLEAICYLKNGDNGVEVSYMSYRPVV